MKNNGQKILILAPHTDDGELGCGGSITRFIEEGKNVFYAAFSTAEESVDPKLPSNILEIEVKAATKKLGIKKEAQDKMEKQIKLFDKLPDHCLSCQKTYDKTNKQLAMKWTVVVKEHDTDTPVRLYCDTCWDTAQRVLREYSQKGK